MKMYRKLIYTDSIILSDLISLQETKNYHTIQLLLQLNKYLRQTNKEKEINVMKQIVKNNNYNPKIVDKQINKIKT